MSLSYILFYSRVPLPAPKSQEDAILPSSGAAKPNVSPMTGSVKSLVRVNSVEESDHGSMVLCATKTHWAKLTRTVSGR